mgnify:CR=1 FL=1
MFLLGRESNWTSFQKICYNERRHWFEKGQTNSFSFSDKIWNVWKTEAHCLSRHLICQKAILICYLDYDWWGDLKDHRWVYRKSREFDKIKKWADREAKRKVIGKIIVKPQWIKINFRWKTLWIELKLSKVCHLRIKNN